MRTPLIALALLVTAPAVRADMGVPWEKSIERRATLEIVKPTSKYTLFLVSGYDADQLPESGEYFIDPDKSKAGRWSRHYPLRICAVPNDMVKEVLDKLPERYEFEKKVNQSRLLWSTELGAARPSVPLTDPREKIVQHYRVELTTTEVKVELIHERVEKKLPNILVVGGGCLLSVLTVGSLVVWLWRKRVTRTTRPSS